MNIMIFLKLIISLCLIMLPAIVLFRDWKFHDRRTKNHHSITQFILILWLIAGFSSVFFVWKDTYKNDKLGSNIENISKQNEELIKGKNTLVSQNQDLKEQIENYQIENKRLREKVNKMKSNAFDQFPNLGPHGGIRIYNRQAAISKYYKEAFNYFKQGKIIEAKDVIELILEKDSNHVNSLNLIGVIYYNQNDKEKALSSFEKALMYSRSKELTNLISQNIENIKRYPNKKIPFEIIDIEK